MPLYNFKCVKGHKFQDILKTQDPNPQCPICEESTEKVMGLSSFQLKGSGWAKDGYG